MTTSTPTAPSPPTRRRWLVLGTLAVMAAGAALAYRHFTAEPAPPEPPAPDLSQVDPVVRRVIEAEQDRVRREPRSGVAWGRLGMAFHAHVFASEALACFEQAEKLDPENPRWPYFRGLGHLAHDPPAAEPHLRRAVDLCRDDTDGPRLKLAELYLRLGRPDEAREHFEAVVRRQPTHPRARLGLARLAFLAGDLAGAREHLAHALDHPGTRKSALTLSAEIHQRQGDAAAARRDQARAIGLPDEPNWPDKYVGETAAYQVGELDRLRVVWELVQQNRAAEASALAQQVVRDYPQSASGWAHLGSAQLSQGQLPAAEQSLRAALGLDPGLARAWHYLGVVQLQRGDRVGAIVSFREFARRRPTLVEAHLNLGMCLKDAGDLEAAAAAFEDALRCQPLSAPAHAQLGDVRLRQGRAQDALPHLRQAVELNPEDRFARRLLEEAERKAPAK